jgi:membrane fusion protein, copper/silver efflux system
MTSRRTALISFALLAALALIGPAAAKAGEVPQSLEPIYDSYFRIQKALASDNLAAAKTGYALLQQAAEKARTSAQTASAADWNDPLEAVGNASHKGAVAKTLEEAREAFGAVSTSAVGLAEHFGANFEIHVMFCSKAAGGAGAVWMQREEAMSNPYMGQADPSCGELRKTLKAAQP